VLTKMIDFPKTHAAVSTAFVLYAAWKVLAVLMVWTTARYGFFLQASETLATGVHVAVAYVVRTFVHVALELAAARMRRDP